MKQKRRQLVRLAVDCSREWTSALWVGLCRRRVGVHCRCFRAVRPVGAAVAERRFAGCDRAVGSALLPARPRASGLVGSASTGRTLIHKPARVELKQLAYTSQVQPLLQQFPYELQAPEVILRVQAVCVTPPRAQQTTPFPGPDGRGVQSEEVGYHPDCVASALLHRLVPPLAQLSR